MGKKFIYILLLITTCISCEEMYYADINDVDNYIVIEALVTNNQDQNFVKITKTLDFYDEDDAAPHIKNATVELIDEDGNSYWGEETSTGYFKINHSAVPGKNYKLTVVADTETYESDFQIMPPEPQIDSLYIEIETKSDMEYDYQGVPYEVETSGFSAYLDLAATDSLSNYRFNITKTMEWMIWPPMGSTIGTYGWQKSKETGVFNIAGLSRYSTDDKIKKHSLLFMENQVKEFISDSLIDEGAFMAGWVIEVDQYGLTQDAYSFYESVNGQLEADGKLFDPVYSQLETNFTCTTDPDKEVIGFFELSSYRYFRFYAMSYYGGSSKSVYETDNWSEVPDDNVIKAESGPDFWLTYD